MCSLCTVQRWNGIWFRKVRNFFCSATAGEFDLIIGVPPWVRWSKVLRQIQANGRNRPVTLDIGDAHFGVRHRYPEKVAAEAALDGIYVIRTSLPPERIGAADAVRGYKALTQVERAFRSFKTLGLKVRPIRHYRDHRVRAHIFLCMLAYYVQWHMIEAWRPLLFADEDQAAKTLRDPVASRPAFRIRLAQSPRPHPRRRQPGSQLSHPARRSRRNRAEPLPPQGRRLR